MIAALVIVIIAALVWLICGAALCLGDCIEAERNGQL